MELPKLKEDTIIALKDNVSFELNKPLFLLIDYTVALLEQDIVNLAFTDQNSEKELLYRKLKAEGAKSMGHKLKVQLTELAKQR